MAAYPHFWWYVARSAGISAFLLLTFSMWLGLGVSSRIFDGLLDRPWVYEVHKFSSLLSLGFIGLHMVALLLDPYINYTLVSVLVPGASGYRPVATAWGVLGMYGAVFIIGSFYVRDSIGYRTWRLIHYGTFLLFVVVLVHGLFAGTDSSATWMRWVYWAAGTGTTYLVAYRILSAMFKEKRPVPQGRERTQGRPPQHTARI